MVTGGRHFEERNDIVIIGTQQAGPIGTPLHAFRKRFESGSKELPYCLTTVKITALGCITSELMR